MIFYLSGPHNILLSGQPEIDQRAVDLPLHSDGWEELLICHLQNRWNYIMSIPALRVRLGVDLRTAAPRPESPCRQKIQGQNFCGAKGQFFSLVTSRVRKMSSWENTKDTLFRAIVFPYLPAKQTVCTVMILSKFSSGVFFRHLQGGYGRHLASDRLSFSAKKWVF